MSQGSVVGHTLFNLFFNDFFHFIIVASAHNFADDNTHSSLLEDVLYLLIISKVPLPISLSLSLSLSLYIYIYIYYIYIYIYIIYLYIYIYIYIYYSFNHPLISTSIEGTYNIIENFIKKAKPSSEEANFR